MIAHHLVVALAKFRKSPFTTAANVLTLALGLACFIAAYGITTWWRAADSHHAKADRIVVVGQATTRAGEDPSPLQASSNVKLATYLRLDFPEIEPIARAMTDQEAPVAADQNKALLDVANVDPEFLQIFDFEFIAGDVRTALTEPNGVVLTADAARRLFGDGPALGQPLLLRGNVDAVVTGVISPMRQPSFMGDGPGATLRFDMLEARFDEIDSNFAAESWFGYGPLTFAVLPANMSLQAFNARLPAFLEARVPADQRDAATFEARAFPVRELTTYALDAALSARGGAPVSAVAALLGLGALILLVACVNYANLATAQSAARARETGMRKVLGAGRIQVMAQAWTEALALTLLAVLVALGVLALAAPVVETRTGVNLLYFLSQGVIAPLGMLAALVAVVGLLAGGYPALVLSGVRPADVLLSGRSRSGPRFVARILVGVQFASASFLLILVTVTQLQRDHLERTALAPRQDPIVILNDLMDTSVDYDTLAARLSVLPGVRSVSVIDRGPWDMNGDNIVSYARTPEPGANAPIGYLKGIGYDYFSTLNLEVLAGRIFDPARGDAPASPYMRPDGSTEPYAVVVDEAYAERLGFADPQSAVDAIVHLPPRPGAAPGRPARIIGVTESERTRVEIDNAAGNVYVYFPRAFFGGQHPIVRIARDDVAGTLAAITGAWDELAPAIPVNIRFFDDLFARSFQQYARIGQTFVLLASAAFAIASIGLLGMAVHMTSRRRHEIGVRKTLGSTTLGIVRLLLIDFSKPILAANLLAWPAAYFAAQTYLSAFADRVPLTPAPFAFSLALTLAIAWAAVIGEVLKAASVRPAEVLRHA